MCFLEKKKYFFFSVIFLGAMRIAPHEILLKSKHFFFFSPKNNFLLWQKSLHSLTKKNPLIYHLTLHFYTPYFFFTMNCQFVLFFKIILNFYIFPSHLFFNPHLFFYRSRQKLHIQTLNIQNPLGLWFSHVYFCVKDTYRVINYIETKLACNMLSFCQIRNHKRIIPI